MIWGKIYDALCQSKVHDFINKSWFHSYGLGSWSIFACRVSFWFPWFFLFILSLLATFLVWVRLGLMVFTVFVYKLLFFAPFVVWFIFTYEPFFSYDFSRYNSSIFITSIFSIVSLSWTWGVFLVFAFLF